MKVKRKFILYIVIFIFIAALIALSYRTAKSYIEKKKEVLKEIQKAKDKANEEIKRNEEKAEKIEKEIEKTEQKMIIDNFNSTFEFRSGSQTDNSVKLLIDHAITNNKKNKDLLVEFVFDKKSYGTDPESIIKIKNYLKTFNNYEIQYYEVSLDYNEEGYVYKVNIETR